MLSPPECPQMPLNRRSSGRQGGVHELSAFEQLVVELVRHDDSWPFMKLVSKIQVNGLGSEWLKMVFSWPLLLIQE